MDIKEIAKQLGSRGGKARADKLTPQQKKSIATKAARIRWQNKKPMLSGKDTCKRSTDNPYICSVHNQFLSHCSKDGYTLKV